MGYCSCSLYKVDKPAGEALRSWFKFLFLLLPIAHSFASDKFEIGQEIT